jgi:hypothetical protein
MPLPRSTAGAPEFFLIDPSGNWLEFKPYRNPEAGLGRQECRQVGDAELR